MASFIGVLKEKNFFFLWLSQIVSQFGDRLDQMALIALVYSKAPGSTFQLAKILSFTIIPAIILGPIVGVYIDRWDRKKTMIICDIIRGFIVLLIPIFLIYLKTFMPIYVVVFLVFSISCFFIPARLSIIPNLVSEDKLLIANSLSNTTGVVAAFMGFALGGLVVEMVGPRSAFYLDSLSYFISAGSLCFIVPRITKSIKASGEKGQAKKKAKSALHDIKEGIVYLLKNRHAKFVTGILFLLMAGAGTLYVTLIVFIQDILHSATRDVSLLGLFLGVGYFFGSLLYGKFGQKTSREKSMFGGLFSGGILLAVFSFAMEMTGSFYLAMGLCILLGMSAAPVTISSNTLIHEIIREDMRGRIFTSMGVVMSVSLLIFMFVTSIVAEFVNKGLIISAVGLLLALCGSIGLIWKSRKQARTV